LGRGPDAQSASALTSFVGRAPESAKVAALLARHRMVTVTGPGGSGKTRLAIEVARGVVSRFEDGVWLVEQAQIEHPGLVPTAAAIALGVREQPGLSLAESLAAVIGGRHVLLVLDNCEHVIDAAAGLCDGLLRVGDDLRVLATGREPLGVAGEVRFRCRHCRCRPARRRRGLRDASPSRFSPTVPARLTPTSRSPRRRGRRWRRSCSAWMGCAGQRPIVAVEGSLGSQAVRRPVWRRPTSSAGARRGRDLLRGGEEPVCGGRLVRLRH
jgi:hypothetical protein